MYNVCFISFMYLLPYTWSHAGFLSSAVVILERHQDGTVFNVSLSSATTLQDRVSDWYLLAFMHRYVRTFVCEVVMHAATAVVAV